MIGACRDFLIYTHDSPTSTFDDVVIQLHALVFIIRYSTDMFKLAPSPSHPTFHQPPSPLTPRSTNTTSIRPTHQPISCSKMSLNPVERPHETTFSSPLTSTPTFAPDFPQTPLHASRRRVDPRRAISQSAEQKRGQRRESYMNKVKEQREEGRWDARGDQVCFVHRA